MRRRIRAFHGQAPYLSLADLQEGKEARIAALHRNGIENRLKALGFVPGRLVKIERRAHWGGPLQVSLGTTEVILRPNEAQAIEVVPL